MAFIEMSLFLIFIAGLCIVLALGLFFWGLKHALYIGLNSVIGFFALYAVNLVYPITINIWSVLLVGLFGLFGLLLVLLFHWMGIRF